MPSETRLRKLGRLPGQEHLAWPEQLVATIDADGYVSGYYVKRIRPNKVDPATMFDATRVEVTPDDDFRDRHWRLRWKVEGGKVVCRDRPLEAGMKKAEVAFRLTTLFTEDERMEALEDAAAGSTAAAGAIRAERARIEGEVDAEIAAATPLRSTEAVEAELRSRRQ